jgi:hypothetical protein
MSKRDQKRLTEGMTVDKPQPKTPESDIAIKIAQGTVEAVFDASSLIWTVESNMPTTNRYNAMQVKVSQRVQTGERKLWMKARPSGQSLARRSSVLYEPE